MSDNKSLFAKDTIKDVDNEGVISQSQNFNNTKYVKKWMFYWEDKRKSTDISYTNDWKLGETVEVVAPDDSMFGQKGKICLGFSNEPSKLRVKFKNGKKEFVEKEKLAKISIYDYLDEIKKGE